MACAFPTDQVVVVGGGLAGVSACNTVVENGGKTVLIDKSSFCGGNSTKATSGINGAATRTQKAKGIEDSTDLFTKDTLKGGAKKPEIAKVLCENSGRDVEWLMDAFNLDLSLVARLGGHSAPRTHRGKERFPGMTITYALIQMVEKISETTDRARIITKARGVELIQGTSNNVVGLVYEKGGAKFREYGPVILCTGGFGADFSSTSLLAMYRPDLMHLPTTNGEHCTGDGIKMGEAIGAKTIDLEWVQVHPTGLVKPDDADAKIKFLAAEALRGVGGLILNKDGQRFANELGRRDYVTGEMWKNKAPFRLALNKAASDEILWHCKHYTSRGVMKFYENGEALAKDMGVPLSVLEETHQKHYEAAKKTEKDPDGGSWPAYPSGKSWDEPSGKTGSGKKFYHNIIDGAAVKTQPFFVAIITPVIHYCMGGLEIDADGAVIGKNGVMKGLFCAGEVAGGVHGNNRLGGNSLLDCVVFGRVTGKAATKQILGADVTTVDLKELTGGGLSGAVTSSKLAGGSYEDSMNKSDGPTGAAAAKKVQTSKFSGRASACGFPTDLVIVVGGGLAGVSACNTVVENGGKTVLIDKSSFCGGNSTKATSGINGAFTRTQKSKGIEDSTDLFTKDTLKGGAKKPEIVKVLCENSGRDVEWLMDAFNLDLSLVARLGGHSAPRTHRGKERFPGMTITYALIQMVEKISEMTDKARIITKARGTQLLQGPNNTCVGLAYEKGGETFHEFGPVILCTGGFGADFSSTSLLAMYRPDLMHLPTTNGEHCTGDGIKMGEAIGAKTIDLEWVQVHPTGLVKPDDADAKIKFLAAEALRGVGGLILNKDGQRFANELGRRDYVTGEMWKNKAPFRLALNKAASDEILWHCKHYTSRGVMKYYESGDALANDMGVPLSVLEETHQKHYEAAKKMEKDPDGGSWPAYPSGKSWDEASGKTGSGKKFYHNIIDGAAVKTQPFFVAIITPVIHYCMGGLEIDADGAVMGKTGVIKGLYCAGEVAGGVHGNNRLGGNSLLDCVVFGRVTGKAATKYCLGSNVKAVDLKELTAGGLDGEVKGSKFSGGSYEDNMNEAKKNEAKKPPAGHVTVAVRSEDRPPAALGHDGSRGTPYIRMDGSRTDTAPWIPQWWCKCHAPNFEDKARTLFLFALGASAIVSFVSVKYLTP